MELLKWHLCRRWKVRCQKRFHSTVLSVLSSLRLTMSTVLVLCQVRRGVWTFQLDNQWEWQSTLENYIFPLPCLFRKMKGVNHKFSTLYSLLQLPFFQGWHWYRNKQLQLWALPFHLNSIITESRLKMMFIWHVETPADTSVTAPIQGPLWVQKSIVCVWH